MEALNRIERAGFNLNLLAHDAIEVIPASRLNAAQRDFLKAHKKLIISELKTRKKRQSKYFELPQIIDFWLCTINAQHDERTDLVNQCKLDPEAVHYFEALAKHELDNLRLNDDRRFCRECLNLSHEGICKAAAKGKLNGYPERYKPIDICPRRCKYFVA